jgi:hypothetical protein
MTWTEEIAQIIQREIDKAKGGEEMTAQREMTLREYLARLPSFHLANKEFHEIETAIKEAVERLKDWLNPDIGDDPEEILRDLEKVVSDG